MAWHIAALQRSKKLPTLDSLLRKLPAARRADNRPQSLQTMEAMAKAWTRTLGGKVRKVDSK